MNVENNQSADREYKQPNRLRALIAFMITRNWSQGIWRGLIFGLIAGTL